MSKVLLTSRTDKWWTVSVGPSGLGQGNQYGTWIKLEDTGTLIGYFSRNTSVTRLV